MSTDLVSRGPRRPRKASRRLVTIDKAAEYLQVKPRSIRRYIADGKLPRYPVGPTTVRVDLYARGQGYWLAGSGAVRPAAGGGAAAFAFEPSAPLHG
jgi:excisionase family DNA binding protein